MSVATIAETAVTISPPMLVLVQQGMIVGHYAIEQSHEADELGRRR